MRGALFDAPNANETSMPTNMIVAPQPDAVEVGARIFKAGGNAVDAAIACAFAQCVIDQMMCGIAGFGAMHLWLPARQVHEVITFLSEAPGAVRPGMWEDLLEYETRDGFGFVLKGRVNDLGYQSIATPGSLKGFHAAHSRYGKLGWDAVIAPAIKLADGGYRVTPQVHQYWTTPEGMGRVEIPERLRFTPAYASLFFDDKGGALPIGSIVKNPDLAQTLGRIAAEGPDVFYRGAIAARIDADMRAHGGLLAADDLAAYQHEVTPPIRGAYRGLAVAVNPPPGAGIMLLKMLQILEHFDLKALGHNSPAYIRVVAEAMKRAQIEKDRAIGDPRFKPVPLERFVERAQAAADAAAIKRGEQAHVPRALPEAADTTHLCTLDAEGNAVSMTHTNGMQSGVITHGLGFMYNGAMGMFDPRPGRVQSLEARKRRVSSISPTMLLRDGKPTLLIGAPGGSNIPMGVLQVILNVVDHGMTVGDAVAAPRFSATSDLIDVAARIPQYVCEELGQMGYRTLRSVQSFIAARVHAIKIDGDAVTGGADPAGGGMALAV
jgi:gamma-glutamyltranspeptidase/glutathione hydrolase